MKKKIILISLMATVGMSAHASIMSLGNYTKTTDGDETFATVFGAAFSYISGDVYVSYDWTITNPTTPGTLDITESYGGFAHSNSDLFGQNWEQSTIGVIYYGKRNDIAGVTIVPGTTYTMVVKYELNEVGADDDTIKFWVNPALGTGIEGTPDDADPTRFWGPTTISSDDFQFRRGNSSDNVLQFDNVTIWTEGNSPFLSNTPAPPIWTEPLIVFDGLMGKTYNDTLRGKVTDPNGDVITFTKKNGPDWLSLASNGDLSGVPDELGTNLLSFIATDGTSSSTGTVNIAVLEPLSGILQSQPELTSASEGSSALRIDESNDSNNWISLLNNYGGTVYIGFDWNITDNAGETGAGGFYGGLGLFDGSSERLLIGNASDSINYGLAFHADVDGETSIPYVTNTAVRLVCKLEIITDGDDSSFLFIDQATEGLADATKIGNYSFTTLTHRTGQNPAASDLENLVVSTTYDDAYTGSTDLPVWITIETSDTEAILSWTALDKKTYGVETINNLTLENWQPIANGLGIPGGGTLFYTNAVGSDQTFYQVISE